MKRPKKPEIKRGTESPELFRKRMLKERRKLVKSKFDRENALRNKLRTALLKPAVLRGCKKAKLEVDPAGPGISVDMKLFFGGDAIGHARVYVWVKEAKGKIEASIEELQGFSFQKKSINEFRKETGMRWSVALAQAVIDAAYETGFDRVGLVDITTTDDYKNLHNMILPRPVDIGKARHNMEALFNRTRRDCRFTKREGDYWIREFP